MNTVTESHTLALSRLVNGDQVRGKVWSLEGAYKFCEQLARSHYENFPVGSLLVPAKLRKHFYSIYAFARIADDLADEGYAQGYRDDQRLDLLAQWRDLLIQSASGRASHPVFIALAETRSRFHLPISLFEDLLSAFIQDVVVRRYTSFTELLDYCRRSANPIGRLILLLFGHRDEKMQVWSDSICTALQLANHWQDVGVDLDKDRIYLPAEDLARFQMSEDDVINRVADEKFRRLLKFEVGRTRELFVEGKPLCYSTSGRLALELRAVWCGGTRILERIEESRYDVFSRRPVITPTDKLRILLRAFRKGAFRHL
jgi:phytoene synthase